MLEPKLKSRSRKNDPGIKAQVCYYVLKRKNDSWTAIKTQSPMQTNVQHTLKHLNEKKLLRRTEKKFSIKK